MNNSKIKVLYIAGTGRSGSTILGNLIGEVEGCFTTGEPVFTLDEQLSEMCGCGKILGDCRVWDSILRDAFKSAPINALQTIRRTLHCTHHYGNSYTLGVVLNKKKLPSGEYLGLISMLYHSIQRVTGAEVIIDGSKKPAYGLMLKNRPDLDVWILHLVRDPRAVAFSWMRKKKRPGQENTFMYQKPALSTAIGWLIENLSLYVFFGKKEHYFFLRYEDFVLRPRKYFDEILAWIGLEKGADPFIGPRTINIRKEHHLILSNPVGVKKGNIELINDNEWREKMSLLDKVLVTLCTWPILLAYRYPL